MINRISSDLSTRSVGEIMADMVNVSKYDLIRDCMNYQKLLFGFGCDEYSSIVHDPSSVFDTLYDMEIDVLQAFTLGLSSLCRSKAIQLTNNL